MYVFGGVRIKEANGARLPADKPGWVHALNLETFTWTLLQTRGALSSIGQGAKFACALHSLQPAAARLEGMCQQAPALSSLPPTTLRSVTLWGLFVTRWLG